jgi:hypothetical protein
MDLAHRQGMPLQQGKKLQRTDNRSVVAQGLLRGS